MFKWLVSILSVRWKIKVEVKPVACKHAWFLSDYRTPSVKEEQCAYCQEYQWQWVGSKILKGTHAGRYPYVKMMRKFAELAEQKEKTKAHLKQPSDVDVIRAKGWMVAVHNDYRLHGQLYTFWLFTKDNQCVKGEAQTDTEALQLVNQAIADLEKKTPNVEPQLKDEAYWVNVLCFFARLLQIPITLVFPMGAPASLAKHSDGLLYNPFTDQAQYDEILNYLHFKSMVPWRWDGEALEISGMRFRSSQVLEPNSEELRRWVLDTFYQVLNQSKE